MTPIFVSFFTPIYADEAAGLKASLEQFGLEYDIQPMRPAATWAHNCGRKPAFIRAMLNKHKRPVVWLDADARIKLEPRALVGYGHSLNMDVAYHFKADSHELLSGTLYFNNTASARHLLTEWEREQRISPDEYDQSSLQRVIGREMYFSSYRLGPEYAAIHDANMCDPKDVVIEHRQASRILRTRPQPATVPPVWLCIPSAKDAASAEIFIRQWRDRGYKLAIFQDAGATPVEADLLIQDAYPGYAKAVNRLCHEVMAKHPETEWFVTGGDDVYPIQDKTPEMIADDCYGHFAGTLGIMQPTGDRWMTDETGKCAAERVCVSPWIGRKWVQRGYNGHGPLCEEYPHFFVDEDLKMVAEKMGILWHRPDLTQHHANWQRIDASRRPAYLEKAHQGWGSAKLTYLQREAAGFPGSELLACS